MDDLFEPGPCAGCGAGPGSRLAWRPAFGQILCAACCRSRSDAELLATELANTAARLAAETAAKA